MAFLVTAHPFQTGVAPDPNVRNAARTTQNNRQKGGKPASRCSVVTIPTTP